MKNVLFPRTRTEGASLPARRSTAIPRWVKVFVVIILVLVLLFVILHLTGNGMGSHMHMSMIEAGRPAL